MRKIIVIIAFLVAASIGFLFFGKRGTDNEAVSRVLPETLEFVLSDYDGREVKLSDFRGKPVVVNAWASWCPFCIKELPDFVKAQEEFQDKVVIIAVNRRESLEVAKSFSDVHVAAGKLIFLLDPADTLYQAINGFSMPETVFVDRDGIIRFHKRGPMDLEEMRRRIQEIL